MAKSVIKFSAVPYEIGGKKGLRPQLEAQPGVYDLDFCTEVVNEKCLAMSPDGPVVVLGAWAGCLVLGDWCPAWAGPSPSRNDIIPPWDVSRQP